MALVKLTMIVPAALTPLARGLAAALSPAGAGMFTVPCAPIEADPRNRNTRPGREAVVYAPQAPTHYASSGFIEEEFAALVVDAQAMFAAVQTAGAPVTQEQCEALVSQSIVIPGSENGLGDAGFEVVA